MAVPRAGPGRPSVARGALEAPPRVTCLPQLLCCLPGRSPQMGLCCSPSSCLPTTQRTSLSPGRRGPLGPPCVPTLTPKARPRLRSRRTQATRAHVPAWGRHQNKLTSKSLAKPSGHGWRRRPAGKGPLRRRWWLWPAPPEGCRSHTLLALPAKPEAGAPGPRAPGRRPLGSPLLQVWLVTHEVPSCVKPDLHRLQFLLEPSQLKQFSSHLRGDTGSHRCVGRRPGHSRPPSCSPSPLLRCDPRPPTHTLHPPRQSCILLGRCTPREVTMSSRPLAGAQGRPGSPRPPLPCPGPGRLQKERPPPTTTTLKATVHVPAAALTLTQRARPAPSCPMGQEVRPEATQPDRTPVSPADRGSLWSGHAEEEKWTRARGRACAPGREDTASHGGTARTLPSQVSNYKP